MTPESIGWLLGIVRDLTVAGALVLILIGSYLGIWVWGRTAKEQKDELMARLEKRDQELAARAAEAERWQELLQDNTDANRAVSHQLESFMSLVSAFLASRERQP